MRGICPHCPHGRHSLRGTLGQFRGHAAARDLPSGRGRKAPQIRVPRRVKITAGKVDLSTVTVTTYLEQARVRDRESGNFNVESLSARALREAGPDPVKRLRALARRWRAGERGPEILAAIQGLQAATGRTVQLTRRAA
jgi:hypothetical protein